MLIAKQVDVRTRIKKYFDLAFNGEHVIIPRKENKNVVIISESDYKLLEKAKNNIDFLLKLDRSDMQIQKGETVIKTIEELENLEKAK